MQKSFYLISLLLNLSLTTALQAQEGNTENPFLPSRLPAPTEKNGKRLVWHDEFNGKGIPDTTQWRFETGFMRNHEDQWYNGHKNCYMNGEGALVIEARRETVSNPRHDPNSNHWAEQRSKAQYTSASMQSRFTYRYGHVEVRARLATAAGAWPAIWQVGTEWGWPEGGEIDIMEYYPARSPQGEATPSVLANWCWGGQERYKATWNSKAIPLSHFTRHDPQWAEKYHVWTLDWTTDSLCIRLDNEILNVGSLEQTVNPRDGRNPFSGEDAPKNLLWLNLALGGDNGGPIDDNAFPMRYYVDYVRIYQ